MPTMTKRVNVRATVAVRNTNPPIYGTYKNIIMTTGDILKCLTKRATVDEILPDGSTIRLNYKNYYTDNGAGLDAKGETKIIKSKKPPVKKAAPAKEVTKEPEVSFNENPISKVDETIDSGIMVTEGPAEDGIESDDTTVVSGTMDEEGIKLNLLNGETLAVTHEEIIAAAVEETKEVNTDGETASTIETAEVADSGIKVEGADAEEETPVVGNVENNTEENPAVPEKKSATNTKKKSTSTKKKK